MEAGEPMRVLVVEDHAGVREGIVALLRRQQMSVVAEACDGFEAIALYRRHQPDITLMDLRMPRMDGLSATRAIVAEFPQARIIVFTNSEGEEQSSLQAGAKALVQKDAPSSELLRVLHAVHSQNS